MKKIKDGIVDQNKFNSSRYKILWVLKEGNISEEDKGKDMDLCDALQNDWHKANASAIPTFRKMIYATYGILNPDVEWPIPQANEEAYEAIKHIAYININKYPGGSSSEDVSIEQAYNDNKEELLKQIADINPNIIIFGNTLQYFSVKDLESIGWNISMSQKKYVGETNTAYYTVSPDRLCIHAYHPASTKRTDEAYWYEIKTAVQNWEQSFMG